MSFSTPQLLASATFSPETYELSPTLLPIRIHRLRSQTATSSLSQSTKLAPRKYSPHCYKFPNDPLRAVLCKDMLFWRLNSILECRNFRWWNLKVQEGGRWRICMTGLCLIEIVRRIDVEAKTLSSCSVCLTNFLLGFMIWYDSL